MHYIDQNNTNRLRENKGRFSPNMGGLKVDVPSKRYVYSDLPTSSQWERWALYYEKMARLARTQQRKWKAKELNPKKYR